MATIKMYTTPFCGFCTAAKRLLDERGYGYEDVDVSQDPETRSQVSRDVGGWPTVPMIFVGDEFVGGYQELSTWDRSGKLAEKMQ